jgi:hypothetical protein
MSMPTLADKAIKVKLTIHRPTTVKCDTRLTEQVQAQERDKALRVTTRLFSDKHSPVAQMFAQLNTIYAYHREHTLPYIDAGPRLLPNSLFMEYTDHMRQLRATLDTLLATHLPTYDALVQEDMQRRGGNATRDDYPSRQEFSDSMQVSVRFDPLPRAAHFLFDVGADALAEFERGQHQLWQLAHEDTLNRVLTPVQSLLERLRTYTGSPGERFHASLLTNIVEGVQTMRKLLIDPSPSLLDTVAKIERLAVSASADPNGFKESTRLRHTTRDELDALAKQLADYQF